MVKRTGPTNPLLKKLIQDLRKKSYEINSNFLRDIAEKLNKPRRQRVEVNLAHIDRHTKKGDKVIIPGIVLGYGDITKPITIYAWKFSKPAQEKIKQSKSNAIYIDQLLKENPKGKKIRILC